MFNFYIILKRRKVIVFLFDKVFFFQNILIKKKNIFFYILKVLFNFGLFDFRIFFLIKNTKKINGIKL